jgi:hypothetical protein
MTSAAKKAPKAKIADGAIRDEVRRGLGGLAGVLVRLLDFSEEGRPGAGLLALLGRDGVVPFCRVVSSGSGVIVVPRS